ncbi:hypothetical protein [Nonomuraea sp. LPB2021202275-12-8]
MRTVPGLRGGRDELLNAIVYAPYSTCCGAPGTTTNGLRALPGELVAA